MSASNPPRPAGSSDPIGERLRANAPKSDAEIIERLRRQLSGERAARLAAEDLAEGRLRDLYEGRERAELLSRLADEANRAYRLQDAFKECMKLVGQYARFTIGHAFMVISGTQPLESSGTWWEETPGEASKLRDATAMLTFNPGMGLPGQAWMRREVVWLTREEFSDKKFPRNFVVPDLGINEAVAFPVFAGSEVVAIMEFFGREVRPPDTAIMEIFDELGKQLGRIVERVQAESTMERRVLARTADLVRNHDEQVSASRASHGVAARVVSELLSRWERLGERERIEVLTDLAAAGQAHGRVAAPDPRRVEELVAALPPMVRVVQVEQGLPAVGIESELLGAALQRLARDDARDIEDEQLLDPEVGPSELAMSIRRGRREVELCVERSTPWRPRSRLVDALRIDHLAAVARRAGGELVEASPTRLLLRVPGRYVEASQGDRVEKAEFRRTLVLLSVEREIMRLMARSVLEGLGCTVETDYFQATVTNRKPDAVFTDLSRAPTYLKRSAPGTIIIGLSTAVTEDARRKGIEMGLSDVLNMPLARDDVAAALRDVLGDNPA